MFNKTKHSINRCGFTLIELLVVIAIIALIVGILAPGLKGFKDHAKKIKQKSNIRNAEIGLELFYDKFQEYPDSSWVEDNLDSSKVVCGAQHLVEALVGRDEQGFDPRSKWHEFAEPADLYDSDATTGKRSINRRKAAFLEFRDTGAYLLEQLYDAPYLAAANFKSMTLLSGDAAAAAGVTTDGSRRAPILTDVFSTRKPGLDEKVGSPIVYFRADPKNTMHRENGPRQGDNLDQWTYNYEDNAWIFQLPNLKDPDNLEKQHRYDPAYVDPDTGEKGVELFYQAITNKNSSYEKPHNPKTYIIISAGTDGIFGTRDDVTNF